MSDRDIIDFDYHDEERWDLLNFIHETYLPKAHIKEVLKEMQKPRCRCMCEASNKAYEYNLALSDLATRLGL